MSLPTGTVTFLRTDVEGSMTLVKSLGARWDTVNATHLGLIRAAVDHYGGVCVRTEGDAFFGVFPEAGAAVAAAVAAQRSLVAHDWPANGSVRVRMALHSGEAHLAGDDYGGFDVNKSARIAAVGHGGQIVLSDATRVLVESALEDGVLLRDLGRHALRDVSTPERLFQLDVPGLRTEFPALRTPAASVGVVPLRMTSFVGRDAALAEVLGLLDVGRLVTVTGPGGIGKTSLATEVARDVAHEFSDGAWFVALDQVPDSDSVLGTIARTLGLHDGPERSAAAALLPFLANRSTFLVLDNFEHVLDAASHVGSILRTSPGSRVLVTSRAPLHIGGEQEYPLAPLEVRGEPSSGLFVDRARAVRPGWDPGPDGDVVDQVCELLDGLPLGIELAAARVAVLPVTAIRDRLAARLPLPGTGPRDVPSRQRTLDGAIGWSHDLLGPGERRLLHELAVFEGSFDVHEASAVAGSDALEGIGTLVDQSLVTGDPAGGVDGVRFRLLRTIRSFALGRLIEDGREPEVRRRHAEAYLSLAEAAAPSLPGGDQPRWLDRLALDHPNLRAATRWAIDAGDVDIALRLVAAQWRYWQFMGHLSEAQELADAALALPGAEAPTPVRLRAITAAGGIAYWRGQPYVAVRFYDEELELATRLGDVAMQADACFNLAYRRFLVDDFEGVTRLMAEAVRCYEAVGDARGVARLEWTRGTLEMRQGRNEAALAIFESALPRFEELGDAWYKAMATGSLAWARLGMGDVRAASGWFVRSLVEYHAMRDIATTTISLPLGTLLALEAGRPADGAVLLGAFEQLSDRYGVKPPAGLEWLIGRYAAAERIEATLQPDEMATALQRGRRMSLDDAVALIVDLGDAVRRD